MMLSVGAWAQTSLQEQINSADAGTTVTLSEDVTLTARIDINKNITVDLGSHTITTTATCGNGSAFNIVSGTVTIQNGTIDASFGEANSGETDAITARSGSDVTLKELNITVKSKNGACAYAFDGSKITIKSGHYENQTTEPYQYNASITAMVVNQANVATQLIFIEGGTFKGYDPTLGDDSQTTNENATFLAPGVALKKNADGNYEATTAVAKIGGRNYASIKDAIAAATEGQIVTLLTDINEAVENTNVHNFTIDLNGKTWTSEATSTFKNNGGTVTITDETGNGTIKNTANAKDMGIAVWARTGSVIIENGTFISQSNYEATLYVGTTATNLGGKQPTITVKGGTFKNEAEGMYAYKESLLPLTLNVYNTITDYQAIIISGGTFCGNNPALGDDNMGTGVLGGNFLAEGYVPVKDADGNYIVVEGTYVAQIGDVKYATLAEAVAAVPTDGTETTITMLTDVDLTATVTVEYGKNVVLDLNNHNITSTVTAISNKGNLEVTGIGNITVNGTTKTAYGINNYGAAGKKANLIIGEEVSITAPCTAVYTNYGKTIVHGTLANTQVDASNIYSTLRLNQTSSEVIVAESAKVTGVVNAIYGSKGILEVNSTNVGKIYADGSATQGLKIKKTTALEELDVVGHAECSDIEDYYVAAKAISGCTGTVKLLSDINGSLALSAGKTVTLDLNGHKVTAETYPIKVEGNLTITGEGTAQSTGMGSGTAVQAATYVLNNGKLTILSGNYVAGFEGADGNPAVYVRDNAEVYIKGGDFVGGSKFLLNKLDSSRETSKIEVTGGTFHNNFNPADNPAEGEHTNFVADGYKAVDNGDGTFTVKAKDYIAQIGENKYETLADAIAAAQAGETVTLLADINESVENTNSNNFTINLNGKTWTSDSYTLKNNGGTITLEGEGLVKSTGVEGIAVWARTGSIIINGGNYVNCSNKESTVYVGTTAANLADKQPTVTINGGSFKNTAEGVYAYNAALLPLTLNIINNIANADAYQAIVINGGTFYGNDPSIGDDSQLNKINKNSNFVSSELHAEKNSDGVFEIKEGGYVAQVGYLKYVTLAEAAAIAVDKTITLLADATIETIDVVAGKTIEKNGHEITVNTFEVIDFTDFNIPFDFTANTATYTRNVAGNEWGTVCVPFTLKSTANIQLYEFGNIAGDVLTVNEIETAEPGTPVVFANTTKGTSVTFTTENASVSATAPTTTGTLIGTYTEQNITSGLESIYFINGDKFHQAKASLTVPAYRAYIQNTSAGAKAAVLNIVVDGEATAIEGVAADLNDTQAIYDVNGRQLSAPQKGINIMKLANGKTVKVIVK